jgi:ankyrin repeat protein
MRFTINSMLIIFVQFSVQSMQQGKFETRPRSHSDSNKSPRILEFLPFKKKRNSPQSPRMHKSNSEKPSTPRVRFTLPNEEITIPISEKISKAQQQEISQKLLDFAHMDNVQLITSILKEGALVDTRCLKTWMTPLHRAAASNQYKTVATLIQHGANVNVQDNYGNTPLHYAASYDFQAVVAYLLIAHADPYIKNKQDLNTYEFIAKYNPDSSMIDFIKKKLDVIDISL